MSNLTVVLAIITNLRAILAAETLQMEEDGIGNDPNMDVTPVCVLRNTGEVMFYAHGQKPLHNEIQFIITIYFTSFVPTTAQTTAETWLRFIRENITVATLNVGTIEAAQPVSKVITENTMIDDKSPLWAMEYKLAVRYREDDT